MAFMTAKSDISPHLPLVVSTTGPATYHRPRTSTSSRKLLMNQDIYTSPVGELTPLYELYVRPAA